MKFKAEERDLEQRLASSGFKVSNLEECIDSVIGFSSKLATVWDLSDYKGQQKLQFLVFPDGIFYDRKTEECRTEK